jgi:tripartite-type tricarboxylate transporter receptor subunit TctC
MSEGRRRWLLGAAGLLAAAGASAQTERYPARTARLVVPYPPGGFNDQFARLLAQRLAEAWGVPVMVDNRPGGGTLIGTEAVVRAAPDGHVLLMASFALGANPGLHARLPYDTLRDLAPVAYCAATPNLLVVPAGSPVRSVADLVALAKARPGEFAYRSAGPGSSNHLSMELFKRQSGVDLVHVPYKGSAPALIDLVAGRLQAMFDNVPNVLPQVRGGRLRAVAVTTPRRFQLLPELPTMASQGLPDFDVSVWFGMVAPARTPPPVIAQLNREVNRILLLPAVAAVLRDQGVEPVGGSPEQFALHLRTQVEKWGTLARAAAIRLD